MSERCGVLKTKSRALSINVCFEMEKQKRSDRKKKRERRKINRKKERCERDMDKDERKQYNVRLTENERQKYRE